MSDISVTTRYPCVQMELELLDFSLQDTLSPYPLLPFPRISFL